VKTTSAGAMLLALAGCGPEECEFDAGSYRVAWSEAVDGTCGPIETQVLFLDGLGFGGDLFPECAETVEIDTCARARGILDCPTGDGGALIQEIDVRFFAGGVIGAEQHVERFDSRGDPVCMSDYLVTVDKL
jgi:hypothetical protein